MVNMIIVIIIIIVHSSITDVQKTLKGAKNEVKLLCDVLCASATDRITTKCNLFVQYCKQ